MMTMDWRIRKFTLLLVYGIGIDIVWLSPLMVAVFTFLSIYTCFDLGHEGNRCKVDLYDDYHDFEGLV